MKNVLLRGPFLTSSGYGVHARQVAKWLFDKEFDLDLDISVEALRWGDTPWLMNPEGEDGLVGRLLQACSNAKPFYDVTIQVQLPNEWNPLLGTFNIGITAGVEADRCYPHWVEAVNKMDLVIVPSEFTRQTFLNSGEVTTKILVVPESFVDEIRDIANPTINLDLKTDFNFLVFGQITGNNPENDRKNIPYTLKWLAETFAKNPDVGIVLKMGLARQSKIDENMTRNLILDLMNKIGLRENPKLYLLHGHMTNAEVAGLYRHPKIKALVSLTRGEGYGLPILEAAASGLPVMAPGWSGHMEFMKHGKFIKFEHEIKQIHETKVDPNIFRSDAKWCSVKEGDVKQKLLKFVDAPAMPKQWAEAMRPTIIEKYSFAAISKLYDNALTETLTP